MFQSKAPQCTDTGSDDPPGVVVLSERTDAFRAMFAAKPGIIGRRSVSTTGTRKIAAAERPTRPVPAPSSRTGTVLVAEMDGFAGKVICNRWRSRDRTWDEAQVS